MFGTNNSDTQATNPAVTEPTQPAAPPAAPFGAANGTAGPPSPPPMAEPPVPPLPQPSEPAAPAAEPVLNGAQATAPATDAPDDLLDLKQQALQNLQPLVTHLDQTPEEKFKTTMMLIQATDNSSLVKEAYEAANQIADEKARAQALLDVVNEINYFTHSKGEPKT